MTELAEYDWRLVRDEARDGATQMALEEVAGRTAVEDDVRTVRVFSWEPSTLSLGYKQEAETVDWDYCEREGVDVTRRQTGGGGIYHDSHGDISYTIVAPAAEVPGDLMDCYALFCEPILEAFSRMGVEAAFASEPQPSLYEPSCFLRDVHPAHDVLADGKKISGNAQYRQRDVVIQHGSLRYDLVPDHHRGVFETDCERGTFTDRVTSIREEAGISREEAVAALEGALREWCGATLGGWREEELERASALAERKYGADEWVRERVVLERAE
ncbi:lipoate--protein ligase family protein [Natronobiforma cellulositropha]|uniref:lipoate--protein ligase family protein n=1 Tax=Natronobiforma cellulositropha TaxID=1679076 RepID=UPI0021D5AFF2|nr:biotin/lipoate A/B protein ligase family protein [Natronobiforma cellulositropha]